MLRGNVEGENFYQLPQNVLDIVILRGNNYFLPEESFLKQILRTLYKYPKPLPILCSE